MNKKQTKQFAFGIVTICLLVTIYGCLKTSNGLNNNSIIETPYYLFFSDSVGAIYNTCDGIKINKLSLSPDGKPCRALCISGNNILFAKDDLYVSDNFGVNYNHSYDSLRSIHTTAINGLPMNINQSIIVDVPQWHSVYTVTNDPGTNNWLGVAYNYRHGATGYWTTDSYYDTATATMPTSMPVKLSTLTLLKSNTLCGYDPFQNRYFYKKDTLYGWDESTYNFAAGGAPTAPPALDTTNSFYTYGHYNNELIAIDTKGLKGASFSDDLGATWTPFTGLPAHTPLLCINSPFEELCLIGTDSMGVYILNANTHAFQPSNNGLPTNAVVYGIAGKQNLYKNGVTQRYIYLATNKGLYQSKDNGLDWILVMPGKFTAIY